MGRRKSSQAFQVCFTDTEVRWMNPEWAFSGGERGESSPPCDGIGSAQGRLTNRRWIHCSACSWMSEFEPATLLFLLVPSPRICCEYHGARVCAASAGSAVRQIIFQTCYTTGTDERKTLAVKKRGSRLAKPCLSERHNSPSLTTDAMKTFKQTDLTV